MVARLRTTANSADTARIPESLGYALSATLLLLALYPEAQAQIHAELDQVAPLGGNLVSGCNASGEFTDS